MALDSANNLVYIPASGNGGFRAFQLDEAGVPVELALCYADDRARLQINGRTVLSWDDPYAPDQTYTSNVRIGVAGAATRLERLRIDRDVFYVPSNHPGENDGVPPRMRRRARSACSW